MLTMILFNNEYEPCLMCGIFVARSNLGKTVTTQGCDILLLWVPRGYVALANANFEGTLIECRPINDSCDGKEFGDLHDQL